MHSGSPNDQIAVKEKQESFVDDSEIIVTNDSEFWAVDEMVRRFEQVSGAILNRSSKSKVMGLGCWKGQTRWPLRWLETLSEIKIFGIIMTPCYLQ